MANWQYPSNWQYPRQRRWKRALTNNALVAGIVSAIVAGAISFLVVHYQNQDAAAQQRGAEQVAATVQFENSAAALFETATTVFETRRACLNGVTQVCLSGQQDPLIAASTTTLESDDDAFYADLANITDPEAIRLAQQLDYLIHNALAEVGTAQGGIFYHDMESAYGELIARCGQLIQGG